MRSTRDSVRVCGIEFRFVSRLVFEGINFRLILIGVSLKAFELRDIKLLRKRGTLREINSRAS